jgi:hypothetical protein
MKASSCFALLLAVGVAIIAASGCGATGSGPISSSIPEPPNPTPPAKWLYADHYGTFYNYRLPLTSESKPILTLPEWPGLGFTPQIAVDPSGKVAIASNAAIRIFDPPIVSFDASHVGLAIKLTPAITEIGPSGADLIDIEYDPNGNLWLFNNLGEEISELRVPLSKKSTAALTLAFGQPGTKTAGFSTLVQGRFDVNAALYVYARATLRSRLFKISFPYAKPPSTLGVDVAQSDFVDSSQYLPTSLNPASVLLGQYTGHLHSPNPTSPPSPPVSVLGQFDEPLQPVKGLFPNNIVKTVVGALTADAPRQLFYTLDAADGTLEAYPLPLQPHSKSTLSLPCLAGSGSCNGRSEHLFLAP